MEDKSKHHVSVKVFSNLTKEESSYLTEQLSKIEGFKFEVKTHVSIS